MSPVVQFIIILMNAFWSVTTPTPVEPAPAEIMIEAPVIEAPVSTLKMDHHANGCREGWECSEGETEATEACLDDGQETACVFFAFLDGNGIGDSFVIDANGDAWPIHVFEDGSWQIVIVPCGGDADCAEKNPMIAEHDRY